MKTLWILLSMLLITGVAFSQVTRIDSGYVKKGMYFNRASGPGTQRVTTQNGDIPYDSLGAGGVHYFVPAMPRASSVSLYVALSDETSSITTTGTKATFHMPFAMVVKDIFVEVTTASSSGLPTFNVKEAGTTIFSTKPTIDANEETNRTAATAFVLSDSTLANNAKITVDMDVTGTGTKGAKLWLIGRR